MAADKLSDFLYESMESNLLLLPQLEGGPAIENMENIASNVVVSAAAKSDASFLVNKVCGLPTETEEAYPFLHNEFQCATQGASITAPDKCRSEYRAVQSNATGGDNGHNRQLKQNGHLQYSRISISNNEQSTEDNLNNQHVKDSTQKFPSKSTFCEAATNPQEALEAHTKGYHFVDEEQANYFPCPTCDKTFAKLLDLKGHVICHKHEVTWLCFSCCNVFLNELTLRIHWCAKDFNPKVIPAYVCAKCSKIFQGPKIFARHTQLCSFTEYCVQCASQFDSLKDIIDHTKKCDKKVGTCVICDSVCSTANIPNAGEFLLRRVHCRCCGKCFAELNEKFLQHEAGCGVNNRYENMSSGTVFWPPTSKTVWAKSCRWCTKRKFPVLTQKDDHCMFCGKCFIAAKSEDYVIHKAMCAWFQQCMLHMDGRHFAGKSANHSNRLNIFRNFLVCKFCGKRFNENFHHFFRHEITCKSNLNFGKAISSSQSLQQHSDYVKTNNISNPESFTKSNTANYS